MADTNTLTLRLRNDTAERWLENNPVIREDEVVVALNGDSVILKLGDGVHRYKDLPEADFLTALRRGCMYVPYDVDFPWRKIRLKFLNDKLQGEVDAGDGMTIDMSKLDELLQGE